MSRGYRFRFRLESTSPRYSGDPTFSFLSQSGSATVFTVDGAAVSGESGINRFETHETLEELSATVVFGPSRIAALLSEVVKPNDYLILELAEDGGAWQTAHEGLVCRLTTMGSSSISERTEGLTIASRGPKKLFEQSIYNWQASLGLGLDGSISKNSLDAYRALADKAVAMPPHELIAGIFNLFMGSEDWMPLKVFGKPIQSRIRMSDEWRSRYSKSWPFSANRLMSAWMGSFWEWIQTLVDPAIHECFWRYSDGGGVELVHRPRPFPGMDWGEWARIGAYQLGNGNPTPIGFQKAYADDQRANAFHWSPGGFTDANMNAAFGKMNLGWWMDVVGRQRYGYAPRSVNTNMIPCQGQEYLEMIQDVLRDISRQDCALHRMANLSLQLDRPFAGIRPGNAVDWPLRKLVGYLSSVSHHGSWSNDGLQLGTTLGVSRVLTADSKSDYPRVAAGMVALKKMDYLAGETQTNRPPHEVAKDAQTKAIDAVPVKPKGSAVKASAGAAKASKVPNAETIQKASKRWGVPAWLLAECYQHESGMGRANTCVENPSFCMGPMQISRVAVQDLNNNGYKTPAGNSMTYADRNSTETSLDAGAAILHRCASILEGRGLTKSNPAYWQWVASAYNKGPGAAGEAGEAKGWAAAGLIGYGKEVNSTRFGGLG